MFTGIVEEIGQVTALDTRGDSAVLTVRAQDIVDDLRHGASVAVDGVCLTVVGWAHADGSTKVDFDVMGETLEEVEVVMRDLRDVDVDILTLGQYLRPSESHIPIDRYVTPEEFRRMRDLGMAMGFKHVESGPLVRSSYHAWEQVQAAGV